MKKQLLFYFVFILVIISCDKSSVEPKTELKITLNNQNLSLCVGSYRHFEVSLSDSSDHSLVWEIISGDGTVDNYGNFYAPNSINEDSSLTIIKVSLKDNPDIFLTFEVTIFANPYNTFENIKTYYGKPLSSIELESGEFLTYGYKVINNYSESTLWKHDNTGYETDQRIFAGGQGHIIPNGNNHGIYKSQNNEIWIFGVTDLINNAPAYLAQIDNNLNILTDQAFQNIRINCMEIYNNNIFLAGDSSGIIWIAKLNANLEKEWTKIFQGNEHGECSSLIVTNNIITMVGNHYGHSTNYFFRKLQMNGDELAYVNKGAGEISSIVAKNNQYLIHGRFPYLTLAELSEDGETNWEKHFFNSGNWFSRNITQTPDNNYVMTGWTSSEISNGAFDGYLIKVDPQGNEFWTRNFGSVHFDYIYHVLPTKDSGFLLSGKFNEKFALIKTDNNGKVICPCECY